MPSWGVVQFITSWCSAHLRLLYHSLPVIDPYFAGNDSSICQNSNVLHVLLVLSKLQLLITPPACASVLLQVGMC